MPTGSTGVAPAPEKSQDGCEMRSTPETVTAPPLSSTQVTRSDRPSKRAKVNVETVKLPISMPNASPKFMQTSIATMRRRRQVKSSTEPPISTTLSFQWGSLNSTTGTKPPPQALAMSPFSNQANVPRAKISVPSVPPDK
eukprot:1153446-Prymnesium_polylepis.1